MKASPASVAECSAVLCVLLLLADVATTAPAPYDYDSVRDLYEVLLQREAMADNLLNQHRIVRKNNRSPSLRLRFGRRSDPAMLQVERNILGSFPDGGIDN
ncbi:short neuropeptide F [Macrosteles quadrilineatus]|uniref:short neuropeptide F n=1 Tax=Macrosteles quadrilineatus TaxID=74068 RepID=UPI0023E0E6A8|nr:short neuropeptide F [Macrosteles quadrilineatus]